MDQIQNAYHPTQYESIDNLVTRHIKDNPNENILTICKSIVVEYPLTLRIILNSESNKPSKYDLMIINYMIKSDYDFSDHLKLYNKRNNQQLTQSNNNLF